MELNISTWLNALEFFLIGRQRLLEACTLSFPIVDKAAKARAIAKNPSAKGDPCNKVRMVGYFTEEFEQTVALATGIRPDFTSDADKKVVLGDKSIGEWIYHVRNSYLHESGAPNDVVFLPRQPGKLCFGIVDGKTAQISEDFFLFQHFAVLVSPEYTSLPAEFAGKRIRFGGATINPSECLGNFDALMGLLHTPSV